MDAANMSQNTEQSKAHVKACDSNENKIKLAGTSSVQYCYCIQYSLFRKNINDTDTDTVKKQFFVINLCLFYQVGMYKFHHDIFNLFM
jgi:hypothetical protein